MAAATVSKDEALEHCLRPKSGDPTERWLPRREHFGEMFMAFGVICMPPFRGLHVELRAASGRRIVRQDMDLGLWLQDGRVLRRIYQLTITSGGSFQHMEADGTVHTGAHEHIGDRTFALDGLTGARFDVALRHFCERTNLTLDGSIDDPYAFRLRG